MKNILFFLKERQHGFFGRYFRIAYACLAAARQTVSGRIFA